MYKFRQLSILNQIDLILKKYLNIIRDIMSIKINIQNLSSGSLNDKIRYLEIS